MSSKNVLISIVRNVPKILAVSAVVGLSYFTNNMSKQIQDISLVKDGISTCYQRVNQSFTAKMIGDNSASFIQKAFLNSTEECFSEVLSAISEFSGVVLGKTKNRLNVLSSDVHWFHKNLVDDSTTDFVNEKNLSFEKRFENIEGLKDSISLNLSEVIVDSRGLVTPIQIGLVFAGAILFLTILFEYMENRTRTLSNIESEDDAEKKLMSVNNLSSKEVESIIRKALKQNKLVYCAKLFSEFNQRVVNLKFDEFKEKDRLLNLENTKEKTISLVEEKVATISEPVISEIEVKKGPIKKSRKSSIVLTEVSLDEKIVKVVEMLKTRLFTEGIVVDFAIDEDLVVMAKEEPLEQILYHILINSIKSCRRVITNKVIRVSAKKLGASLIVDITDTGLGFGSDFLESESAGLNDDHLSIGLKISKEFMNDFEGQVSFENLVNNHQQIVGSKIRLLFRAGVKKSQLVSIKKGTKRELLQEMQA